MSGPNWSNRTLWTGDNLDIMRGMNSESVDLIYLDPPFNSNRDYSAPIGSEAAGAAFKDTWTLSDVDEAWHGEIGCQRRSKSTPLAGVKMHHLMRFSPALAVVPVVHRRDPRCFV